MKWLRQCNGRDVLKLLAVVLPALLLVGAGLGWIGWIVHEYRIQAREEETDYADAATTRFYRQTALLLFSPEEGEGTQRLRSVKGEGTQRLRPVMGKVNRRRRLEGRLADLVARRNDFPSASAAFLWDNNREQMQWSTNLVGDCQCLASTNWMGYITSARQKPLSMGWRHLRDFGADSDSLVLWSRNKLTDHVCGLVIGPPVDDGLPIAYVAAGTLLVGMGLILIAGGVSLAVTVLRARVEMERRNTFVSNAAHEVKTPLASILMRAERLVDGSYPTEERRAKAAGVILEQGRELRRRIERLRDFDRLERGMRTYERQAFDLGEAVRETARPLSDRFEEHGLDLSDVASVRMVGDRDSVMEIVENLLTNAAKYAAHAGTVSVRVARSIDGRMAEVCVADRGPGLPAAQLRHVFDRDWRAPNDLTKSVGGWGVGLAFARDLARDMGGELSVAARPGGGCAFTLILPLGEKIEEEKKT